VDNANELPMAQKEKASSLINVEAFQFFDLTEVFRFSKPERIKVLDKWDYQMQTKVEY
jgi:hypothetical protein